MTYAALVLALLLSALDQLIVATALPHIVQEPHATRELGWIVMPIYGKLSDRLGQTRVFLAALVLFLVGSALCGLAPSVVVLTGARAIQGFGGGGLMIGAQSIVALIVPARRRAAFLASLGSVFGVAGVVGPLLGGAITDTIGWRWIFFINLPLGLIALVVAAAATKLPRPAAQKGFDWAGATVLSITVTAVVIVCSLGGTTLAWGSPITAVLIAIAVAGLVGFVLIERKVRDPLIPLPVMVNRMMLPCSAVAFLGNAGMFGVVAYLPTLFQNVYHVGTIASGMLLLPLTVGLVGAGIAAGKVVARSGRYRGVLVSGTVIATIGMALLGTIAVSTSLVVIELLILLTVSGLGIYSQLVIVLAQSTASDREIRTVTGFVSFIRKVSVTIGITILGALFGARLAAELAQHPTDHATAYQQAFVPLLLALTAVYAAAVVVSTLIPRRELDDQESG